MSYLSEITVRRAAGLLIVALIVLASGTWAAVRVSTDYLVNAYVMGTAKDWANFLAKNLTDLGPIAAGERPSAASEAFFLATRKSDQVFRYTIFNRDGYSQLTVDRDAIAPANLSEFSADALQAIKDGQPFVDIEHSTVPGLPSTYAEGYVPVFENGHAIAVVAAYVDQTEARDIIRNTTWMGVIALFAVTALAFSIPAVAWYRRTREKQQADRRIRYLAHHDTLTGLANRARLTERLEGVLATLPATGGMLALHFIDLDRFKQVNDTLGHDGGDFLLATIGKRLTTMTRIEDMVARLGGDEFVVVQTGVVDKAQAETFANRIVSVLRAPMYFHEQEICPHITIGVALAPRDGLTAERLLKSADLALYAGKTSGRDCVRFFEPEMDEAMKRRLELERTIRHAVTHDGFVLHYQPVFEMNGRKLVGFEALARLYGDDGEPIPPSVFIPCAEELRLIDRIGEWVLREACRTAASWPKELTVAVNLSPVQFASGKVEDAVREALRQSGLAPHRLELEVTESLLLGNDAETLASLQRLKDMGVSIVMDDFGTGYSSLSYLWKFPFDKIKIDRSFMQSFGTSGRDVETVVKTIIALGRELNMRVTVEGVENSEQVDFLYDADADQVQGFYFGKPVPAAELAPQMLADFVKALPAGQKQPERTGGTPERRSAARS